MRDYGFKYKIGDVVTTKVKSDCKMMILDQILQVCPGGEQRHYKIRAFIITRDYIKREPIISPATEISQYNKIELEAAF